jgi:hypothetical protein
MADYLPVMLSMNHPYPDIEKWIIDRFESLNDKEVFVVTQDMLPEEALMGVAPYAKAWLWDVVPKRTTRIMYLDFDIVPMRPLPEIPDAAFAAVADYQLWADRLAVVYPFFERTKKYFNAGFFVARRDTQPYFDQLKLLAATKNRFFWNMNEQPLMNFFIQETFDVHWLPETFNCMSHAHFSIASEAYMLHFAGMNNGTRWTIMALLKAFLGVKPIQTAQQDEKYAFVFEGGI